MAVLRFCLVLVASLWMLVSTNAAPPSPSRLFPHGLPQGPAQLQQINPLDYYLDNADVNHYYQGQQKHVNVNNAPNNVPARLENLEPDSEVELIPGAQQPQIPQQTPVSPNLPGLVPGQRVFIVHMPVPGYRPGTIGGYQPVYIVSAAPQGNHAFPAHGYQNGILVNPAGQAIIPSVVGYARQPTVVQQPGSHGVLLGAPLLNRPYELLYPEHYGYQPVQTIQGQGAEGTKGNVRLSQLVALQSQPIQPNEYPRAGTNESQTAEAKRLSSASDESKESAEGPRRNARPVPPHALGRAKP